VIVTPVQGARSTEQVLAGSPGQGTDESRLRHRASGRTPSAQRVRGVIHAFNERGFAALNPK